MKIIQKIKKYNKNISQDVKYFFKIRPKNDKQIDKLVLKYKHNKFIKNES